MRMNTYADKEQMVELGTSLLKALVKIEDAQRVRVQELIENPAELKDIARSIVANDSAAVSTADGASCQLSSWTSLYVEMGITLDPSQVKIPERKSGFDRLIVVSKGMTPQKAFDLCTARFGGKTRKYTSESLNTVVPTNDRTADKGPYAVWVRDLQEADEELKNLSATMLTEQSIAGITLTERLLLELAYHQETKQHLDTGNWTLCSGSRYSGGGVPDVLWGDDELEVLWNCSDNRHSRLRSRAVVTL